MDVVVTRTAEGWVAERDGSAVGSAAVLVRPDGRCFVGFRSCRAEAYRPLVEAIARQVGRDLHTELDEADAVGRERLQGLGFAVHRRDHLYLVPTDPAVTGLAGVEAPAGFELVGADRVDEDRLRELDDELRRDVPGCDGWRWDREGFRRETYEAPDYDPATYLVAVEVASGRCAGLVRVWNRPGGPRLGLVAVGRPFRRRGLARLLLARVLGVLHQRGEAWAAAEFDVTNAASNALLAGLGARRTGGSVELRRPGPGTGAG
jgi:ribosomal protein S18 acetylase RimI-like enzyme